MSACTSFSGHRPPSTRAATSTGDYEQYQEAVAQLEAEGVIRPAPAKWWVEPPIGLRFRPTSPLAGIADLRQQRDVEAEERRRLTMVLADLRARSETVATSAAAPPPRRSWWRWGQR